jgi:hypothetical protein
MAIRSGHQKIKAGMFPYQIHPAAQVEFVPNNVETEV